MSALTVDRKGRVTRTRLSGNSRVVGYVDRADRQGRPHRTWRAVAEGGAVVATGLPTRRAAIDALDGVR